MNPLAELHPALRWLAATMVAVIARGGAGRPGRQLDDGGDGLSGAGGLVCRAGGHLAGVVGGAAVRAVPSTIFFCRLCTRCKLWGFSNGWR